MVPPIPLIKEEEKVHAKGLYTALKLCSNAAEENSPIYEIQVPYFKSGTCEQFLEFMDKVQAVIVGQNLTTGPQKVAFMRMVLKGDAYFNQYFKMVGNEDDAMFVLGVQLATAHSVHRQSPVWSISTTLTKSVVMVQQDSRKMKVRRSIF